MFLRAIGLLFQMATTSHPRAGAMSPKGGLALLVVHSPHSTTQNLGSTPTTVPIHQLSSPQPAQPKKWDPLHCHTPLGLPTSPVRLQCTQLTRNLTSGDSRTLNCSKSAHNNLLKTLEPFPQHEISLACMQPSLQTYNLIFSIKLSPTMVVLKHNMVGALFLAHIPPLALQNQHEKLPQE
jgi:hypothetical protein